MVAQAVDGTLAALAGMRLTHSRPEAQSHRHPNGVGVHVEAQVGHGRSLHPGASVRLSGGEEACPCHLVGPFQEAVATGFGERLIPGALLLLL